MGYVRTKDDVSVNVVILDESAILMNSIYSVWKYNELNTKCPYDKIRSTVISRIGSLIEECEVSGFEIIMAMDDNVESIRKKKFPMYKANRPKKDAGVVKAMAEIRDEYRFMFPKLHAIKVSGYEADDIVHSLVKTYFDLLGDDVWFTIQSKDDDFMALLNVTRNVSLEWFDGRYISNGVNVPAHFKDLRVEDYEKYAALSGGHNGLKKLLKPMETKRLLMSGALDKYLEVNDSLREQYEFNLDLVKLMFIPDVLGDDYRMY